MTAPDTGHPPTGPGRLTAPPMSWGRRLDGYLAQNAGRALTPRQKKRLLKKSHQAEARFAAALRPV